MSYKIDTYYRKKNILGIDIGTGTIKTVQLEKRGKLIHLVGYGNTPMSEGIISEGIISEPEKAAKIIQELIKNTKWGKITAQKVNASLPETKIFTRIIELPPLSPKELKEAVMWEAEQYIPVSIADLYLDWQVIGDSISGKKGHKDILLAAAPKSIVDSYLKVFELLNLEPYSLEMSLVAIIRAIISSQKTKNKSILIIDIGAETTNFGIFDQFLRIAGSTPIGGQTFTKSIAKSLGINQEKAEQMKRKWGTQNIGKTNIKNIIQKDLDSIATEVKRIIKYYEERSQSSKKVEEFLLCGGATSIKGLAECFSEKLGKKIIIGNPWTNISIYPLKPVPKIEAPAYTTAIGLALKGIEGND